jgi:cysteine synthase
MKFEDVMQMVGNTPHVRVRSPEAESANIYVKLEGYNPTGSIKDRAYLYMIRGKRADIM